MGGIAAGDAAPKLFFEQALGFPAREALVDEFDRDTRLFAQTCRETGGFIGHVAGGAIEAKREANNDLANRVTADKFAKAAHIFVAINAFEGVVRLGDAGSAARQSKADFAPAVVEREDLALRYGGFWGGRFGNLRHQASIA